MIKTILNILLISSLMSVSAQNVMTPEILIQLNKVSGKGISKDGKSIIYTVSKYNKDLNSNSTKIYSKPLLGGESIEIKEYKSLIKNKNNSPDGNYVIKTEEIKLKNIEGSDFYNDVSNSNVQIYDALNYRHWDTWEDGEYNHLILENRETGEKIDIMEGEAHDSPLQPFGGAEDYIWNHNGTKIIYVTKRLYGTAYAQSTNTDIFAYDLETKTTTNLSESNKGYDTNPAVSKDGTLAWLQMDEPGYEADKNDIIILDKGAKINLTKDWDGTVSSFQWSTDGKKIYFIAPFKGTKQLFELSFPKKATSSIKMLTNGQFDVTSMIGQSGKTMVVTRTDMNHSAEIYTVDLKSGKMMQLTHVNDDAYAEIQLSKVEKRMVTTTDGKEMLTWVIYPPNFDPAKKYPTLLYCQGGPQSPLSQFYSVRWNFQLMAANGYIVVAPNRRGMPGHGVEWNEQISGDWGGQNIQDYLSAIDDISTESYVDTDRLGAIGASYGGYSVFYLAGNHEKRFKTFIAHDGVFNTRSMLGTTEELFFVQKDFNGNYWDEPTPKAFTSFNPINHVAKWDTPILIIQGGKDFRVPIGQGLEAFQAAQLKGLKSKLLYFPEENHWILNAQNGIIWQREFFKWLDETLK